MSIKTGKYQLKYFSYNKLIIFESYLWVILQIFLEENHLTHY